MTDLKHQAKFNLVINLYKRSFQFWTSSIPVGLFYVCACKVVVENQILRSLYLFTTECLHLLNYAMEICHLQCFILFLLSFILHFHSSPLLLLL